MGREPAGPLSRDLVNPCRAMTALQPTRSAASWMGPAHRSAGAPRAKTVAALDRAFQDIPARADAALRTDGAGSRRDRQDDATALFRVRDAIETRTCRDATGRVRLTPLAGAVVGSVWFARRD